MKAASIVAQIAWMSAMWAFLNMSGPLGGTVRSIDGVFELRRTCRKAGRQAWPFWRLRAVKNAFGVAGEMPSDGSPGLTRPELGEQSVV